MKTKETDALCGIAMVVGLVFGWPLVCTLIGRLMGWL